MARVIIVLTDNGENNVDVSMTSNPVFPGPEEGKTSATPAQKLACHALHTAMELISQQEERLKAPPTP